MSDEQWFYCLKHGTVEGAEAAAPPTGSARTRTGRPRRAPWRSRRERTEAADEADREWKERGAAPRGGSGD